MMNRYFISIGVLLTVSLQGCMITPRTRTSDLSIPATWSAVQDSKPVEEGAPSLFVRQRS